MYRITTTLAQPTFTQPAKGCCALVALLCLSGCFDKDDTGGTIGTEVFKVTDWAGTDPCEADSKHMVFSGQGISSYQVQGYDDGTETSFNPTNVGYVTASRTSGPCPQTGSSGTRTTDTDPATDTEWYLSRNDAVTRCLGDATTYCSNAEDANACSGKYKVSIVRPAGIADCTDFEPVRFDLDLVDLSGARSSTASSDCTSGSGRFDLLPVARGDHDGDGDFYTSFVPIQRTGTGVMTNQAWVTSVILVDDNGNDLRVIEDGEDFVWNSSDQLVNYSSISTAITGQHSFSQGVISGNPPFVAWGSPRADLDDMVVDMAWSCGTGGNTVTRAQGWQFKLSDIGCDPVQKITMRYATSPNRIEFEPYGNPNLAVVAPATTTQDGKAFSVDLWGLVLEGTLTDWDANEASVTFDSIEFLGDSACTADDYTFNAE
mgnify:CR=1 FL=1